MNDEEYIKNAEDDDLPEIRGFTKLKVEDLRPGFYYYLKIGDSAKLYQYVVVHPDKNEPVFKYPDDDRSYFTIDWNEDLTVKLTKYKHNFFRQLQSPITIDGKLIYLRTNANSATSSTRSLKRSLKRSRARSRTRSLKRSRARSRARSRKRSRARSSRH